MFRKSIKNNSHYTNITKKNVKFVIDIRKNYSTYLFFISMCFPRFVDIFKVCVTFFKVIKIYLNISYFKYSNKYFQNLK